MGSPAIDCNFGKAKIGDTISLPSPFKMGPECVGALVDATKTVHTYVVTWRGVFIGTVKAVDLMGKTDWNWRLQ